MGTPTKRPPSRSPHTAVYAGSFDPITNGHLDIVRRAFGAFDRIIVAVAMKTSDPGKEQGFFTPAERAEMIRSSVKELEDRVVVDHFSGLLVDYCEKVNASAVLRGLRAVADFEYEFQMAMMNRHLKPHIETYFLCTGEQHFYTSSRLVKEVAALGGDIRGLVPDIVYRRLLEKLGRE